MKKEKTHLLSIIIPTKDRYGTLLPVIDCILSIDSNELELVIQDNSEDTALIKKFLTIQKDKRLKYFHEKEKLSQTENSDLAVKNCIGEYVCFIGDDDAVIPYIVDLVQWMKENNYLILKGIKPEYSWPGMPISSTSSARNGVLVNKQYSYRIEEIMTNDAINHTLSKGGTSMKKMPCLYHGIVAHKVLQKIYNRTGSYFPGPSPDMANAVGLTQVESKYILVNIPVVISGKSNSSIGGQGVKHNHVSHIDNVSHLSKETSKKWSAIVPKYWTGPTIWAESTVEALRAFNNTEKINKLNINYLIATIFIFHMKYRKQIFNGYDWNAFKWNKFVFAWIELFIVRSRVFIKNRFYSRDEKVMDNISNTGMAINQVVSSLDKNKMIKLYGINPK